MLQVIKPPSTGDLQDMQIEFWLIEIITDIGITANSITDSVKMLRVVRVVAKLDRELLPAVAIYGGSGELRAPNEPPVGGRHRSPRKGETCVSQLSERARWRALSDRGGDGAVSERERVLGSDVSSVRLVTPAQLAGLAGGRCCRERL